MDLFCKLFVPHGFQIFEAVLNPLQLGACPLKISGEDADTLEPGALIPSRKGGSMNEIKDVILTLQAAQAGDNVTVHDNGLFLQLRGL